jgi:hypothetical protein
MCDLTRGALEALFLMTTVCMLSEQKRPFLVVNRFAVRHDRLRNNLLTEHLSCYKDKPETLLYIERHILYQNMDVMTDKTAKCTKLGIICTNKTISKVHVKDGSVLVNPAMGCR